MWYPAALLKHPSDWWKYRWKRLFDLVSRRTLRPYLKSWSGRLWELWVLCRHLHILLHRWLQDVADQQGPVVPGRHRGVVDSYHSDHLIGLAPWWCQGSRTLLSHCLASASTPTRRTSAWGIRQLRAPSSPRGRTASWGGWTCRAARWGRTAGRCCCSGRWTTNHKWGLPGRRWCRSGTEKTLGPRSDHSSARPMKERRKWCEKFCFGLFFWAVIVSWKYELQNH